MMFKAASEGMMMWWKDIKLWVGVVLIILNFVIGFYAKVMMVIKINDPFYWWLWVRIYAFSWLLLFAGIFLTGWETYRIITDKVNRNVKKTVRKTYRHAKSLPRKGVELHRKSMSKIAATSKMIVQRMK